MQLHWIDHVYLFVLVIIMIFNVRRRPHVNIGWHNNNVAQITRRENTFYRNLLYSLDNKQYVDI